MSSSCKKLLPLYVAKHSIYASFLSLDYARMKLKDFDKLPDLTSRLLTIYNELNAIAPYLNNCRAR